MCVFPNYLEMFAENLDLKLEIELEIRLSVQLRQQVHEAHRPGTGRFKHLDRLRVVFHKKLKNVTLTVKIS